MLNSYSKSTLVLGYGFAFVTLGLLAYALLPETNDSKEIWVKDDTKYDRAFITLATTDTSVLGVLVIAYSIRETNSKYPLVVMVSDAVTEPYLKAMEHPFLKIKIHKIQKLQPPSTVKITISAWKEALNKLAAWTLIDYTKTIFLDADMLVLQNIDDWFDLPEMTGNVNQDLSCIPEPTPSAHQGGLNAAVLVFSPNVTRFQDMIALLNNGDSWGDSDQGILSHYYEKGLNSLHLIPMEQSTFARCCHAPWFDRTKLKVVHFTHFALNYVQVAGEMIDAPHLKNWKDVPNCDVDFYTMWKKSYHRVMSIVNQDHSIPEPQQSINGFLYVVLGLIAAVIALFALYYRYARSEEPLPTEPVSITQ